MESAEREAKYHAALAEGWEQGYKDYRDNWINYAKNQFVSDYPLLVDLELSSLCNLKCPMCYTITDEFKEKVNAKLMDFSMYKRIIDEIGGKVPALRLSLRGEATLHKNFIEAIRYAKEKGIREVSFLTNGGKMNEAYFTEVLKAGADWITISFDGLGETYDKIRKPLKFDDMVAKIKRMKEIKKELGVKKPVIKVQSVWPAIRKDPQAYYNTFAPHVDLVAYNPLIDYLSKDTEILYEENFSCPQLYQRLVVGADGRVMMCSNDEENRHVVGDTNHQTIHEIWHGEKLQKARDLHKIENGFKQISACAKCYIPRKTNEDEVAVVNNQQIVIKNYVNRAQEVGQ
jgi:radical SAM protein with 4Fe4S-binding SPASM domain